MLWIPATLIAAVAQTGRNAAQNHLSAQVGTVGATAVRFVFGLPFAALFLVVLAAFQPLPLPGQGTFLWVAIGAAAQIMATGFMLKAMNLRGFGTVTALTKTEPVTLALISAVVMAEPLGAGRMAAIALATLGIVMMSQRGRLRGDWWPAALGIMSGALFGLSSVGFQAAMVNLPSGNFLARATLTLALTLCLQTLAILAWLVVLNRTALRAILRHWRDSLGAGFLGAFASQFWFIGFALAPAANVRTLALIEVPLAQIVSGRVFRQSISARQIAGMALIVAGVALLIAVSA